MNVHTDERSSPRQGPSTSKLLWWQVGIGLINVTFMAVGFIGNYVIDTTRNADTLVTLARETTSIRSDMADINRRVQTTVDSMVVDRQATAVRLATMESDIKYIQRAVDELRHANGIGNPHYQPAPP